MLMYSHSLTVWASCSANGEMVALNRIALGIPSKVFTLLCCLQSELGSNSWVQNMFLQVRSHRCLPSGTQIIPCFCFFFTPKFTTSQQHISSYDKARTHLPRCRVNVLALSQSDLASVRQTELCV